MRRRGAFGRGYSAWSEFRAGRQLLGLIARRARGRAMNPGPGSQAWSDIVNPRSGASKPTASNCDARQGWQAAFAAHSLRSSLRSPLPKDGCIAGHQIYRHRGQHAAATPRSNLMAACCECSCRALSGVVVHDGFANLIWASEDWDLGGRSRGRQGGDFQCPGRHGGVRRDRALRRGSRGVFVRDARRAHRTARRRQSAGAPVGRPHRGAPPAVRAPAGAARPGVPAPRAVAALEARLTRAGSRHSRTRSFAHAGDVFESNGDRRRGRIRPDPEDGPRAHGLRPRGALGPGQEHRACR